MGRATFPIVLKLAWQIQIWDRASIGGCTKRGMQDDSGKWALRKASVKRMTAVISGLTEISLLLWPIDCVLLASASLPVWVVSLWSARTSSNTGHWNGWNGLTTRTVLFISNRCRLDQQIILLQEKKEEKKEEDGLKCYRPVLVIFVLNRITICHNIESVGDLLLLFLFHLAVGYADISSHFLRISNCESSLLSLE